ncbi:sulfite exporter TauE/SafE family protein [Mycobacterium sp. OAE908]|uniref:sulfite exporter TauE/SafE family protein n=1 Tax=Mycobacterium sp. OAE908 TaxID=2817899 RepID=UPI001AE3D5D1
MVLLAIGLAVLVGVSLGLLGGGGSILTVPLLAYVAGLDAKHAIATSLLVVGVTSAVGAVSHARVGRVQWRTGLVFGSAGMAGAYAGGLTSRLIPGTVLLVGFALIMIAAAVAMLRGRKDVRTDPPRSLPLFKVLAQGVAVGLVTGLVGAGGGFLVVPALALLGGLPMPVAVGTALVVISMNSFAGLAGHLSSAQIDWRLAGAVTAAALIGTLVGARLTALVNPATLRKAFGWFVLVMASVILAEEVHPVLGVAAAGVTVVAAGITFACTRYAHCPLRRITSRHTVAAATG